MLITANTTEQDSRAANATTHSTHFGETPTDKRALMEMISGAGKAVKTAKRTAGS